MKKIQKIAIGFTIITASLVSALAAPSATRHNKLLSIQQRVMIDTGESLTSASLVSPTAISSKFGIVTVTNTFAAVPLPAIEVAKFQIARVPRFNYEAFWANMDALQACENQLSNNSAAYTAAQYDSASYNDSGEYASYVYQAPPIAPGKYADAIMGGTAPIGSIPLEYASGDITACTNGVAPAAYAAAIRVRQSVSNYARDSLEVLDYVTSQIWIKEFGAADSLKKAVVQYLKDNEIEHAWVDVEFEYRHLDAPLNRRIAMSFQINRADEPVSRPGAAATVGTYMGSQLILEPTATVADATVAARENIIDIKYTAYSQYPDFTINSTANSNFLNQLLVRKNYNPNGVLSWKVTKTGASAISPRICSSGACTSTDGSIGQFKTTSGVYDPAFMRSGFNADPTAPYTLENVNPIDDLSGINCLVTGRGNTNCRMEKHNAATLMQYANAVSGKLDYLGRWEVDFAQNKPNFEELSRAGVFDVCYGVEFKNQIAASYWVRRPHWKFNLYWQPSGVQYQQTLAEYDYFEFTKLPDPVRYTTYATAQNGYNLVGSPTSSDIRSNQNTAETVAATTNYAAVNLFAYDPQTFGLPDREGAIMINPFVSRVTSTGELYNGVANNWMIYRPLPGVAMDMTMASNMRTSNGQPIYKKADTSTPSSALPTGWLARGNNAVARSASFNCVDQNEPLVRDYLNSQAGVPGVVGQYNNPPPDQTMPSGNTPFVGTVQGHKAGTRSSIGSSGEVGRDPDACQISYVPWSTVGTVIQQAGPLDDPNFVAPSICSSIVTVNNVDNPYSGPECIPPKNYYTKTVNVTNYGALEYVNSIQPACDEECNVGGNTKLCRRPYNRF